MNDIDRVLRSNLKLKHLQLLIALDEFRHLGRAAEFLSLTQSAVSKALAEIERMLALDLFVRSTRGTEPTPYGSSIVRFARSVLADYARTQDEIAAVASGAAGRVNVGAMVVATPDCLAPAILALKQHSALTTVSVEEGDLTRLLPRLRVGELDLIVARLEPGYASPDLDAEVLYEDAMCIVVPKGHALARKTGVSWLDLSRLPWVVPPAWASSRIKLAQMFYKQGLNPPTDLVETASFLNTVVLMKQLGAVGFVAQGVATYLAQQQLARILDISVDIELPPVGMMTLKNKERPPACQQLMDILRSQRSLGPRERPGHPGARRARGR